MVALLLAAVSCRSILDIKPGHPIDDAVGGEPEGHGGSSKGGTKSGGGSAGSNPTGGSITEAGTSTGGKGSGGKANGGSGGSAMSGNTNMAGESLGGEGGAPATDPFPAGSCSNCIARNCAAQAQACEADMTCTAAIPSWLGCTEADASKCVDGTAGPLQDLEACGSVSCDLCRHQTDGEPSIDILTPTSGAQIKPDANGLIEVSVQVKNFTVKPLGACGTDTKCGHIHLNLDGANCHVTPFYNQVIFAVDASGSADSAINTMSCDPMKTMPIVGRPLPLIASLSNNTDHADRVPAVQATVTITVTK